MGRFAILEHTGAPDDPAGLHYDLLLEQGPCCRTWRLAELPLSGGPPVTAIELPAHRLDWLDHVSGPVSGGRGFARRFDSGLFEPMSTAAPGLNPGIAVEVSLHGRRLAGTLMLLGEDERWIASILAKAPGPRTHVW